MVDKSEISTNIPTSNSINTVADGQIIDAGIENANNEQLLSFDTLMYQFVRDDCPSLSITNTFTTEQIFNVLKAQQVKPAITDGDLILNPDGTGKVRYSDGSTNTEIASKGYVGSVAFTAGNVPTGGTAGNWLEGNGTWTDPSPATVQRSTSTTALSFVPVNTFNVIDPSAGSIVHYLPSTIVSTMKPIVFAVDGVNSWEDDNWTLNGNGNNIIVVNADGSTEAAAATIDITDNVSFKVWTNGTQYIMERGN